MNINITTLFLCDQQLCFSDITEINKNTFAPNIFLIHIVGVLAMFENERKCFNFFNAWKLHCHFQRLLLTLVKNNLDQKFKIIRDVDDPPCADPPQSLSIFLARIIFDDLPPCKIEYRTPKEHALHLS